VKPVVAGQSGGVVEDRYRLGRTSQILWGQRFAERRGEGNEEMRAPDAPELCKSTHDRFIECG